MTDNPFVDFGGVGEGDDAIVDRVNALQTGGSNRDIKNIWARHNGELKSNAPLPLKDITTMPWMDLENGPHFQRINQNRRGWVNVYMNRGCPYRCTYCHNNGVAKVLQEGYGTKTSSNKALGYLRLRGIDDMIGELKHISNRFPFVTAFSFNDDTFTTDQDHMKKILVTLQARGRHPVRM